MAFLAIAPTGTVLPFAGTTAPEGWVLCNSGEYLKTSSAYEKLFAVIGIAFGETNGSGGAGTTHFRVPDMRGVFPRGSGTNGTANYGGVTGHTPAGGALAAKGGQKTAKNALTVSGGTSTLGGTVSFTTDHSHGLGDSGGARVGFIGNTGAGFTDLYGSFSGPSANINKVGDNSGGGGSTATVTRNSAGLTGSSNSTAANATVTISSTAASIGVGDTETTPASLALNYIIKL
jgi:microcystin-dependent protein